MSAALVLIITTTTVYVDINPSFTLRRSSLSASRVSSNSFLHHSSQKMKNEQHDPPPEEDPESACYRTTTTDRTSEIKCVDVCVEFPSSSSSSSSSSSNNKSRVCRSKPYEEETSDSKFLACERACLDAHFASVSLKFRGDEEKMKEYESVRKRECESGCLRAFFPPEEKQE